MEEHSIQEIKCFLFLPWLEILGRLIVEKWCSVHLAVEQPVLVLLCSDVRYPIACPTPFHQIVLELLFYCTRTLLSRARLFMTLEKKCILRAPVISQLATFYDEISLNALLYKLWNEFRHIESRESYMSSKQIGFVWYNCFLFIDLIFLFHRVFFSNSVVVGFSMLMFLSYLIEDYRHQEVVWYLSKHSPGWLCEMRYAIVQNPNGSCTFWSSWTTRISRSFYVYDCTNVALR